MQQATEIGVGPPLIEDLLSGWCEWMELLRNHSPNTIKLYRRTVEIFCEAFPDPLNPQVTEERIQAWLQAKGGKPSTVSNRVSGLVLLDKADLRANEKGVVPRRVGETRDMAVFLCETGLRIHEAVPCNWPVPCPSQMVIKGKGRKDAIIPVTDKARDAWARLGGKWPIGARATQRRFERAGFSPHQCRHWRATSMVAAGADLGDVKEMMRHENMQTTLGYAAWSTDRVRAALDKVG
jgi:site-specific recombinase XerD